MIAADDRWMICSASRRLVQYWKSWMPEDDFKNYSWMRACRRSRAWTAAAEQGACSRAQETLEDSGAAWLPLHDYNSTLRCVLRETLHLPVVLGVHTAGNFGCLQWPRERHVYIVHERHHN